VAGQQRLVRGQQSERRMCVQTSARLLCVFLSPICFPQFRLALIGQSTLQVRVLCAALVLTTVSVTTSPLFCLCLPYMQSAASSALYVIKAAGTVTKPCF